MHWRVSVFDEPVGFSANVPSAEMICKLAEQYCDPPTIFSILMYNLVQFPAVIKSSRINATSIKLENRLGLVPWLGHRKRRTGLYYFQGSWQISVHLG